MTSPDLSAWLLAGALAALCAAATWLNLSRPRRPRCRRPHARRGVRHRGGCRGRVRCWGAAPRVGARAAR